MTTYVFKLLLSSFVMNLNPLMPGGNKKLKAAGLFKYV